MAQKKKLMTDTEKRIFRILSDDPLISQAELAHKANVSRSSASVHISNLIKKGYIAGRGYVISEYESVVVIGAAMIDLYGKSTNPLIEGESNPGKVEIHPGGVSRNISENLARLGIKVSLITSLCDDPFGKVIKDSCDDLGIDLTHSYFLEHEVSTIYMALLDNDGEMKLALSDTTALDKMPMDHIIRKESAINRGEVIVMDASLPQEIMRYVVNHHKDKRIIIDPVSIGKAKKLVDFIGKFHTVKCNRNEAEFLSGVKIVDQASLELASQTLRDKGVEQVFITLGSKGVFFQNSVKKGSVPTLATELVNVTGAGDAFTAGVAYCTLSNIDIEQTAMFASAMSSFSLESMRAVSPNLSLHEINQRLEKLEK
ncbi:winged helix-turn-helix transcriptional regulator [Erysipelothrix sp. HDW6C]|uniref:carbohydrate kinase n=1 Tax=Erysipelothrix sp. HDW6C TaxID=2714930 RepID=UPI00140BCDDB|nr:carbohydrate kinase [Erysipelothrix sp. HDW6C]QIK69636.1 winged helix-turn-helix transcriptional regulator [Erysipelothrix sp. HDW6C]